MLFWNFRIKLEFDSYFVNEDTDLRYVLYIVQVDLNKVRRPNPP